MVEAGRGRLLEGLLSHGRDGSKGAPVWSEFEVKTAVDRVERKTAPVMSESRWVRTAVNRVKKE
jgi:hypothetical protein